MNTDDCIIIGGGIIGLSLAYELACRGVSRIRILERGQPGREASWAGAGILPPANPDTASHPLDRLRGVSHRLHPQWSRHLLEETGIDDGYRRCGGLYLARSRGEAASLIGLAMTFEEQEIEFQKLSPEELAEYEPALTEQSFRAAYRAPDEVQVRNPRRLQALLAACRKRGVKIHAEAEVRGFSQVGSRLQSVQTAKQEFSAGMFCVAAGAWSYSVLEQFGVACSVFPIRGQMALFSCRQPPFTHVLNEGSRYLVPREDGLVLAGSTEEEAGFDKSVTPQVVDELTQWARQLAPVLENANVEKTWAGLRPGSFDGLPYLGKAPLWDNLFAAVGHFRSGLHLSPGTAEMVAKQMLGDPAENDWDWFRVGRG